MAVNISVASTYVTIDYIPLLITPELKTQSCTHCMFVCLHLIRCTSLCSLSRLLLLLLIRRFANAKASGRESQCTQQHEQKIEQFHFDVDLFNWTDCNHFARMSQHFSARTPITRSIYRRESRFAPDNLHNLWTFFNGGVAQTRKIVTQSVTGDDKKIAIKVLFHFNCALSFSISLSWGQIKVNKLYLFLDC